MPLQKFIYAWRWALTLLLFAAVAVVLTWPIHHGMALALSAVAAASLWALILRGSAQDHAQASATSARNYQTLYDAIPLAAFVYDLTTQRFIGANPAAEKLLELPAEQLQGMSLLAFVPAEERDAFAADLRGRDPRADTRDIQRIYSHTGKPLLLEVHARYIELEGRPLRLVMMQDVSEARAAQDALIKSEKRFRALVEDSSDVLVLMQPDGRVAYASDSSLRVTGYTPQERVGSHSSGVLHPEDRDRVWAVFKQAIEDPSRTYGFEARFLHKAGHYIRTSAKLRNFLADPAVGHLVLNYRDISAEVEVREALQKSEARFRALIETSAEATMLMDPTGRILSYHGAVESILGYTAEERIGRDGTSQLHPDDALRIQATVKEALGTPGQLAHAEYRARAKDGSWQWIDATMANRLHDPAIGALVITHHNITQRKAAEDALRESEKYYRALIENSQSIVLIYRSDGSVSYENPAVFEATLGWRGEDMKGFGAFDLVHPEDLAASVKQAEESQRHPGQSHQRQLRLRAKNGDWHSFDARSTNLALNPVVGGILVQLRDITGGLEAQRQLLRFERLAAIGQTAAGLAHEVRNPLAIISARADFLKLQLQDQPALSQDLDSILRQSERLKQLVNEVLERSNIGDLDLEAASARDLLERALKSAQVRFGPAADQFSVSWDLPQEPPTVRVDLVQMERVLTNLILNAFQALPSSGVLTLAALSDADGVRLEVGDNGPGIPEAKLNKIFEPFYTTKTSGSGLGLWICQSIVGQHGGKLEARNLKPSGSCFSVLLPTKVDAP